EQVLLRGHRLDVGQARRPGRQRAGGIHQRATPMPQRDEPRPGHHLEPSVDSASYRSALAIAAQTSFLVDTSRKLDLDLNKLQRVVTTHRNDGELRQQRFELELERYSDEVTQLLESKRQQVKAVIEKADAGVQSVEAKAKQLHGGLEQIVKRDLVEKIVQRHEQEGARERRAADTWRIVALIIALLALAPLATLGR
ncbi:MAG: hypothetical protein LC777_06070, partial [Actinobacteria bacterium]|nr:hypothetical protein [Actinomycetota bacterium]